MTQALYTAEITEYERGWGQRPDGWLVAATKDAFDARVTEISNWGDADYFLRIDTPVVRFVTPELYKRVLESESGSCCIDEHVSAWEVTV